MGIFSGCQITFEFDSTVSFKTKAALKRKIIDNDGIVSFIVTKKVMSLCMYIEYPIKSGLTCMLCIDMCILI